MNQKTDAGAREKVWELIKDIKTALLVTQNANGELQARPMVAMNKDFNGELWFFTSIASPKIDEIKRNENVLLSYSEPSDQNYVSVRGKARVSQDRGKIKELWSPAAHVWFPKGQDDPNIALIQVTVETAEYWDAPSSAFVYAYGYVKARLTGEVPKHIGENRTVAFK